MSYATVNFDNMKVFCRVFGAKSLCLHFFEEVNISVKGLKINSITVNTIDWFDDSRLNIISICEKNLPCPKRW